jgi:uncharacterized protein (TIGR03435 family)
MSLLRLFAAPRETLCLLAVVGVTVAGQTPLQFEVASIKRNTSGDLPIGAPPDPSTGEIRLRQVPARNLILNAYPLQTVPVQIVNLPSWGDDRYDVIAKGKPNATAEERQQMFRSLLADRMKLAAHYETREMDAYDLVFARADRQLGDGIKPSSLVCSGGPSTRPLAATGTGIAGVREAALQRCGSFWIENDTIISNAVTIANLVRMVTPAADRPIVDKTGLAGYFAVTLRFQRIPPRAATEPNPDAAPLIFTALPEQLGLKLEPSRAEGQILVIDHVERPTEN